jgi:predicted AlkP superfamily pyrophosphatase or phosphodiesterase
MNRFVRSVLAATAALVLPFAAAADAPRKPKLVVAIVVDQFRYEYLLRFRGDYQAGLARLLQHGAVFTDAHYIHAATVTAVGHSTFMSGAVPALSGIIANEWYDRESGATVTSVSDPTSKLVGGIPGATGSSPRRMLVDTLGDEIKIRDGRNSRVISVSIKDRSAILPGGHMADGAYWFDPDSSHWVSSSYYMDTLPEWARRINDQHPTRRYIGGRWFPFGAPDESGTPFCTMVAGAETRYCGSLEATPWGNEMIEEFAEAALEGEQLGKHSGTDVLAISYSSNDYVGHALGPDDPAVRDMSIRTDQVLGRLFEKIEQSIGAGNMLVVLTADHGVAPVPEVNQSRRMPGGRISEPFLARQMAAALTERFGPGEWLLPSPASMPYFNLKTIKQHNLDRAAVEKVAAEVAAHFPHIARVYTRSQLMSGTVPLDDISRAVSVGFYAARSGDLLVLQEPYYLFDATGTSHGTPYEYDNHVPVIFMGPGIKAGVYSQKTAVNDIAPTLAQILGVAKPAGASGRVLDQMFE